jgi:Asp-tRNA(Asn)/Glu-tRNA(Gln) amidotransferase C subunit
MMDRAWVGLSASLLGLALDEKRLENVTAQLARIEEIASSLDAIPLEPATDELAPVWRP